MSIFKQIGIWGDRGVPAFAGEHGAMNNWDKIWKKRTAKIENRATVFEMFKELKRADGFDTQDEADIMRRFPAVGVHGAADRDGVCGNDRQSV